MAQRMLWDLTHPTTRNRRQHHAPWIDSRKTGAEMKKPPATGSGRLPSRDKLPVLGPGQVDIDKVRFPDLADLIRQLRFSTSDGRIWLDDQRML